MKCSDRLQNRKKHDTGSFSNVNLFQIQILFLTGDNRKSGQTLNGHNSIIFKYYKKVKYRF